ncbi:MAG: hypothetical protein ISS48_03365 [Candidatus Aenigmarchaeota archaeon]|nr:hypothetical protein [Candidatus Aenigmarchaeota archaeon]
MKYKKNVERYKTLGKNESKLITKLTRQGLSIFDANDVSKILDCNKNYAYQIIHSLKKKNWIRLITSGEYELLSFSEKPKQDILIISCNLIWPSYISFWTALNFYKFTEQSPRTIFLATTKRKTQKKIDSTKIQFIQIKPERFFGYTKIGDICIAEKEKAIIDSLLFSRYVSLDEICKSIENSRKEISFEKLINYSIRMDNLSLNKRLGYLIELLKIKIDPKLIQILQKNISRSYSLLDPTKPKSNKYNKRWFLNINILKKDLLYWKEIY